MLRAVLVAALLAGCQGQGKSTTAETGSGSSVLPPDAEGFGSSGSGSGVPDEPGDEPTRAPPDAPSKPEAPEPPDPGKKIDDLGAIPAWQAVIDRAQYLGRRGNSGIIFGRVGPPVMEAAPPATPPVDAGLAPSPYVWLIDDTEGNSSLGIRVALAGRAKEGDRVALRGAWDLDAKLRWYWRVDGIEAVPPPATPNTLDDAPPATPGHAIVGGRLPPGARTITVARDNDIVYFQIVGQTPAVEGDGWLVADQLGNTPFALLALPGERPSYGGQDMRSPDERWLLKRGKTYWVRIGKIRKRGDKPALINARTAPVRME